MKCEAWRQVATSIDLLFVPLFIAVVVGGIVLAFSRMLAAGPFRKYLEKENMTAEQRRQLNQHLRATGRSWVVVGMRLVLPPFLFLMVWPLVSPTFCENIRCGKKALSTRQFINPPCATVMGREPDCLPR
jgi:hypothetical protein